MSDDAIFNRRHLFREFFGRLEPLSCIHYIAPAKRKNSLFPGLKLRYIVSTPDVMRGGHMRTPESPAPRRSQDRHTVLARILGLPHLERVVPRLSPDILHRVIQSCGLEDCGEL